MKLIRKSQKEEDPLWKFVKVNLPESLRSVNVDDGYGTVYEIKIKDRRKISSYLPFSENVAIVREDEIELMQPQYFSDFEDLIRKYEKNTGKEVKLIYWES